MYLVFVEDGSLEIVEPAKLLERIFKEQSRTTKEETTKEEIPTGEPKIEVTPKEDTAKEEKN